MVTRADYQDMKETESKLRSRVNDIMEVHPAMHPNFQLQYSGDEFKAKPKYADLIYGKGRKDIVFALIVPTQFKLANTPPNAVDLINESRNKIELISISREDALAAIEMKGWLLDSTKYGEWVHILSQDYLDSLPGGYVRLRDDCVPRRSILRYGSGYVDHIGFYEDEVYVKITIPGYEGEGDVDFEVDLILNDKLFKKKVKELTEKLAKRDKTANDKHRIEEYHNSHTAVCCVEKEFKTKYLDPVMKETHTKKCINKEIKYLKNNFHHKDPWGKKFDVSMTVEERIEQLEEVIR